MKVGVIGACGWAGQRHAEAFIKAGAKLAHIVDSSPSCTDIATRFGASGHRSYRDILDAGLDAVSIALPPSEQPDICREFLSRGVSVLCEKPVAAGIPAAQDIASYVEKNTSSVFMPAFLLRFHPSFRQIRDIIQSGELGRIEELQIDSRVKKDSVSGWRLDRTMGGVALVNGIHSYDLARWLLGEIDPPASSETGNRFFDIPTEDWAESVHSSQAGARVRIRSAWWPYREADDLSLDMEGWVMRLRLEAERGVIVLTREGFLHTSHDCVEAIKTNAAHDLFLAEIVHFLDCIRRNVAPSVSVFDNLAAQKLVANVREIAGRAND
jgi:predicted dehydrogenase